MRTPATRLLFGVALLTTCTVLPACTAFRDAEPDNAAATVEELAQQLGALSRYASRMEELYAAQEAEILALRERVASLAGQNPN